MQEAGVKMPERPGESGRWGWRRGYTDGDLSFLSPDTTRLGAGSQYTSVVLAIKNLNDLKEKQLKVITK